jgi:UPF0755 protein
MNDLDIVFEEPANYRGRSRHRRRPPPPAKKRRGRGRSLAALVIVLLLLGGLGGGAWYAVNRLQERFVTPDYTTGGTGSVVVEVQEGQTLTDIGTTLYEQGVVRSVKAFVEAANANPLSQNIQPGFYEVRLQMRAADALALLLDPASRAVEGITIQEGLTAINTYARLSEALGIPAEEFAEAAEDPVELGVPEEWFERNDGIDAPISIEGFLFPDTYEFPPEVTATEVLETMVQRFLAVNDEIGFFDRVTADLGGVSPYEALIVASLAQAEAGNPDDLGKVARVAYNRVYSQTFPCNCLQFDVTVNYWFELQGLPTKSSAEMTIEELTDPSNPYNRNATGLVPTPINNPGRLALEGAMEPPEGAWLFFVAIDDEGHSAFSETYDQFCADVQRAVEAGVLAEGSC